MFMETGLPWVDAAVFTPQVGDPVSLNVIFEKEQSEFPNDWETRSTEKQYRIECLIADIGQIPIAKAGSRSGDYFTIDGVKYEITNIDDTNTTFIDCAVKIKE